MSAIDYFHNFYLYCKCLDYSKLFGIYYQYSDISDDHFHLVQPMNLPNKYPYLIVKF